MLGALACLALPRQVVAQVCPGTFIQCCTKKTQCTCSEAGSSCGTISGVPCGNGGTCSCTDVCDDTDYKVTGCTNSGSLICSKPDCAPNEMVVTGSCNGSTGGGGGGGGGGGVSCGGSAYPQCSGSCSGGEVCKANASTGSCNCGAPASCSEYVSEPNLLSSVRISPNFSTVQMTPPVRAGVTPTGALDLRRALCKVLRKPFTS